MSETLADGLARLRRFLDEWGHAAAIIGGVAVIARCGVRPTKDIDLVAAASSADVDGLLELATRHGFSFDHDARELASMGLVRFYVGQKAGFGLDVLFADNPYYEELIRRATPVTIGAVTLAVATAEDLVLLKLEADRPLDVEDILTIKDALGPSLDMAYLRTQADRLRLRTKLDLYFP